MSDDLQNSIFDAISILNNQSLENAASTIECVIKEVKQDNQYLVETSGGAKITAIPAYDNASYKVDDKVYVMVPGGDYKKTKIIIGYADEIQKTRNKKSDALKKKGSYYKITSNLSFLTGEFFSLNSYVASSKELEAYNTIYNHEEITELEQKENWKQLANIITQAFNSSSDRVCMEFKVDIKTEILEEARRTGNGSYRLTITIPYLAVNGTDEPTKQTLIAELGPQSLQGFYNGYDEWSTQTLLIDKPNGMQAIDETQPIKIKISNTLYLPEEPKPEGYDDNYRDIFFRNLSLFMVREYPTSDSGISLFLTASEGEWFSPDLRDTKTITPVLMIDGIETSLSDLDIFWGEETVAQTSNYEKNLIGEGYRILNPEDLSNTEPRESDGKIYIKNLTTYTVKGSDVLSEKKYRCRIRQKNNSYDGEITLKRLLPSAKIILEFENNKDGVFNPNSDSEVKVNAYLHVDNETNYENQFENFLPNFSCKTGEDLTSAMPEEKISKYFSDPTPIEINGQYYFKYSICFKASLISNKVQVIFTPQRKLKDSSGNAYYSTVATKKLIGTTLGNENYSMVIENDNVVFHYDSNGDSPYNASFGNVIVAREEETLKPFKIKIYDIKKNGAEIDDYQNAKLTWTVPNATMIKVNPYDSEGNLKTGWREYGNPVEGYIFETYLSGERLLNYDIASRFDFTNCAEHSTFTVEYGGYSLTANDKLIFTKDGMNGTNGTEYTANIVFRDGGSEGDFPYAVKDKYKRERKLKLIYNVTAEKNADNVYAVQYREDGSERLVKLSDAANFVLRPKVYHNSEEITDFTYTVDVYSANQNNSFISIVDNSSTRAVSIQVDQDKLPVTSDLETIKEVDPAYIAAHPYTDLPNYSTVNIVRFVISPSSSTCTLDKKFNKQIYVYYPVDVMLLSVTPSIVQKYLDHDMILPTVTGGFSEVLYTGTGQDPKYDETPFTVSNVPGDVKGVFWRTSEDIDCDREENAETGENDDALSTIIKKIYPKNQIGNGSTKQYIKAVMNFGSTYGDDEVYAEEKQGYISAKEIYVAQLASFNSIKTAFTDFLSDNNWTNLNFTQDSYRNNFEKVISKKIDINVSINSIISSITNLFTSIENAANEMTLTGLMPEEVIDIEQKEREKEENPDAEFEVEETENILGTKVEVLSKDTYDKYTEILRVIQEHIENIYAERSKFIANCNFIDINIEEIELSNEQLEFLETRDYMQFKLLSSLNYKIYSFNETLADREEINNEYITLLTALDDAYEAWITPLSTIATVQNTHDQVKNIKSFVADLISQTNKMSQLTRGLYSTSAMTQLNRDYLVPRIERMVALDKSTDYFYPLKENEKIYFLNELDEMISEINASIADCDGHIASLNSTLDICNSNAYYFRPVIFFNYLPGLEYLNGWDGNSVDIGDDYITCPSFGAGVKDDDNGFSGIVGGILNPGENRTEYGITSPVKPKLGLYGINNNTVSFFLNARNGSASFGKAGASQIIIDPSSNKGYIYSNNYFDASAYPTNDYAAEKSVISEYAYKAVSLLNTIEIDDVEPKSDYQILRDSGLIEATSIVCNTINHTAENRGMIIDLTEGAIRFGSGNFSVNPNGYLYARGGGAIAGWKILNNGLESPKYNGCAIRLRPGYSDTDPAALVCVKYTDSGEEHLASFSQDGFKFGDNFTLSNTGDATILLGQNASIRSVDWDKKFDGTKEITSGFYLNKDHFYIGKHTYNEESPSVAKIDIDSTGTYTSMNLLPYPRKDDESSFRIHWYENLMKKIPLNDTFEHYSMTIGPGKIDGWYAKFINDSEEYPEEGYYPYADEESWTVDGHWMSLNGTAPSFNPKGPVCIALEGSPVSYDNTNDVPVMTELTKAFAINQIKLVTNGNNYTVKHNISELSTYSRCGCADGETPEEMTKEKAQTILRYIKQKGGISSYKDEDTYHYVVGMLNRHSETEADEDIKTIYANAFKAAGLNNRSITMDNIVKPAAGAAVNPYVSLDSLIYLIIAALDI